MKCKIIPFPDRSAMADWELGIKRSAFTVIINLQNVTFFSAMKIGIISEFLLSSFCLDTKRTKKIKADEKRLKLVERNRCKK